MNNDNGIGLGTQPIGGGAPQTTNIVPGAIVNSGTSVTNLVPNDDGNNQTSIIAPETVPNVVTNEAVPSNNGMITPMVGNSISNTGVVTPNIGVVTEPITPIDNAISVSSEVVTPNDTVSADTPSVSVQASDTALNFDLPASDGVNAASQPTNLNATELNTMENFNANLSNGVANNVGDTSQVVATSPNNDSLNSVQNNVVEQQTTNNNITTDNTTVSVGKYLGYLFLFSIPGIGFIMLIVKALDKKDKNISNFAKAQLAYGVLIAVISTVFLALSFSAIVSTINKIAGNDVQTTGSSNYSAITNDYYDTTNYIDSSSSNDDVNGTVSDDSLLDENED